MTEQTVKSEAQAQPESRRSSILRKVITGLAFLLLLLTCIMAAYRKFGG